ncbi:MULTISPECIES: exopolysaccharide production repressor protein [Ensifer]|uniref:exopolysaccharide production repressor protein n=1 Tax=Ensifer TaxID=106591 RepID=UPI00042E25CF|nr:MULTISPECIES: exopolysaccharide production repressor protein [Ensifer]AHK45818.1 exopolysaccharide production repressor protein [Ensifer adhaerens OV14]MDP9633600.1 putative membrane protein [Ensifer adhaerens]NOV19390.1 exopolysaccharide production repressor exox [Ensifer canadensis]OMQ43175.1 exopolysaccharide production repressor exox [Ensifer sp. 1H6]PSS61645.1 exopolysaccharide production repressor exox [Ensifer sp. NM-2]
MFAPRVFASMIGALAVFAIVTYLLNGSLTSTLIQTLVCAVLMQVGYFLAVVFLVWKKARERDRQAAENARATTDEKQAGKVSPGRLNRPGHFNP